MRSFSSPPFLCPTVVRSFSSFLRAVHLLICALIVSGSLAYAAPFALRVNFYPVPVAYGTAVEGYQADNGLPYADRGNQYHFGWRGTTPGMAMRGNSLTTDPRGASDPTIASGRPQPSQKYLSQASLSAGSTWEAQVPNGQYTVRVVCGDAEQFGNYDISVEGRITVSGITTPSNSWIDQTISVLVTDGYLTLFSPSGSGRLNFVEITQGRMDAKVDFRPSSAPNQPGYLTDDSSAYATHDSGFSYG